LAAERDPLRVLDLVGRLATREQLRRELRERYLIAHRTTGGYGGFAHGDCAQASPARGDCAPPPLPGRTADSVTERRCPSKARSFGGDRQGSAIFTGRQQSAAGDCACRSRSG
jgi:hypothetical protein